MKIVSATCIWCGEKFGKDAERNSVKCCSFACRFWSKVQKTETCWWWRGAIASTGYGSMERELGIWITSHRAAWILSGHEPPPSGMYICHHCDNRACVNPDHLFLGSPADNSLDMAVKGRHGLAKLNPDDVRLLRKMAQESVPLSQIAAHFGMSKASASKVALRRTYRHVS